MSENFLVFIPTDPRAVPSAECIDKAKELLRSAFPDADEVSAEVFGNVTFVDAGPDFERVSCPHCHTELTMDWWSETMDSDYTDDGFVLDSYPLPCCGQTASLNELEYHWPQGFASCALKVRPPHEEDVPDALLTQLSTALSISVRPVWQHY